MFTGKRAVGNRRLTLAQAMATKLGDTATTAFCLQRRFMALAFTGDFDGASKLLRECADDYGPWFEVNEYVGNVLTGDFIESVRGRPAEGWKWIVRARDRLRRQQRTSAAFAHHFSLPVEGHPREPGTQRLRGSLAHRPARKRGQGRA